LSRHALLCDPLLLGDPGRFRLSLQLGLSRLLGGALCLCLSLRFRQASRFYSL
jgi:hypothetical protein